MFSIRGQAFLISLSIFWMTFQAAHPMSWLPRPSLILIWVFGSALLMNCIWGSFPRSSAELLWTRTFWMGYLLRVVPQVFLLSACRGTCLGIFHILVLSWEHVLRVLWVCSLLFFSFLMLWSFSMLSFGLLQRSRILFGIFRRILINSLTRLRTSSTSITGLSSNLLSSSQRFLGLLVLSLSAWLFLLVLLQDPSISLRREVVLWSRWDLVLCIRVASLMRLLIAPS